MIRFVSAHIVFEVHWTEIPKVGDPVAIEHGGRRQDFRVVKVTGTTIHIEPV